MTNIDFSNYTILVVDDEEGTRFGLRNWLKKRFKVQDCGHYEEALQITKKTKIDVAVLDIRLQGEKTGIDLFNTLIKLYPDLIVILFTGYGNVEDAVWALKEGAKDYLLKPIDHVKLLDSITKNLELKYLREENRNLKNELIKRNFPNDFIALNDEMKQIKEKANKVKNNAVPICITGESGTGKEVLAKYIHYTSDRRGNPFVVLNCAAISETLLLSELFGHEKGAFTGATTVKIGKFEMAHTGTIFLDEIGDMSLPNQAALLRVLESNNFERVGGNRTINVDVAVITATNQDLKKNVSENTFREDLFYRINVVNLDLPPLRKRKEEISLLIDHFFKNYKQRYKKKIENFDKKAIQRLIAYDWPGNIRELKNVINEIVLLNDQKTIRVENIEYPPISGQLKNLKSYDFSNVTSLQDEIDTIVIEHEKTLILHFLSKNNNNQSKTAKALNVDRKTLWRKLQKYKISTDPTS